MKQIDLETMERSGKPNALRANKVIPAIVYGKGMESISLQVAEPLFKKVISGVSGRNVIINLKLKGKESLPVITHDIQKDPVTDNILHIDFYRIRMDEAIKTSIPIVLIGVATGVKEDAGILVNPLSKIDIKCLPGNIPEKIEVDISLLKINDAIHVSELKAPPGVEIVSIGQDVVVTVAPPAKEEEVVPVEAVPVEGEIPVEGAVPGAEGAAAVPAAEGAVPPAKGAAPAKGAEAKKAPEGKPEAKK